ncbi:hypothetical protein P4H08_19005 [Bacillus cereus]|nr:hypothetical protein [Bacillus cereus]
MFMLSNSNLQPLTPMIPPDRLFKCLIVLLFFMLCIKIFVYLSRKKEANKKGEEK